MINARVLELIQSPGNFKQEDLKVITEEIKNLPYIQSIRALYLYGVHMHEPESYQKILSETAAFTTDKKILYQFINKKSITDENKAEEALPSAESIVTSEDNASVTNRFKVDNLPHLSEFDIPKPVYIEGKLNRILYEGEEDLLNRPAEKIDIEATLESGKIVLQEDYSTVTDLAIEETETKVISSEVSEVAPEKILPEEKTFEETEIPEEVLESSDNQEVNKKVEDSSALSFHGLEEFLPEVKFTPTEIKTKAPKKEFKPDRHALEMERLIAEVEAKMKAAKKDKKPEVPLQEEAVSQEINFAEEMPFVVGSTEQKSPQSVQSAQETQSWKPMNFQPYIPDALLENSSPKEEIKKAVTEFKRSNILENQEIKTVFNEDAMVEESNVPKFINTWQSWLKLDKSAEVKPKEEPAVATNKFDPIEKFIEAEPKISRLSEESNFVVKERNDDISHLMTETLAKLYVEQKLYAKAIRAYETLSVKYPDRKAYFAERVRQVKDIRQGK